MNTSELIEKHGDGIFGMGPNCPAHCLGVARACYMLAKEFLGADEDYARELFVMGLLHDVGYEFAPTGKEHAVLGAGILERAGFTHAAPIAGHAEFAGAPDGPITELDILYCADLIADGTGCFVSFDERIEDVRSRHGDAGAAASQAIAEYLRNKGMDF